MGAEANEILKMNLIRLVAATQSYLTTNVICFTGGGKGAPPYRQRNVTRASTLPLGAGIRQYNATHYRSSRCKR